MHKSTHKSCCYLQPLNHQMHCSMYACRPAIIFPLVSIRSLSNTTQNHSFYYRLPLPIRNYVQQLKNPNVAPTHTRETLRDER